MFQDRTGRRGRNRQDWRVIRAATARTDVSLKDREMSPAWRQGSGKGSREGQAEEFQCPRQHPESLLARNRSLQHQLQTWEVSDHRFSVPRGPLREHPLDKNVI